MCDRRVRATLHGLIAVAFAGCAAAGCKRAERIRVGLVLVEDALQAGPDAVLLIANSLDTAMLAQQLRRRSPGIQLLGTGWGSTADVIEHGGASLGGALFPPRVNPGVADDFEIDRFGDAKRRTHISTVRGGRFLPLE